MVGKGEGIRVGKGIWVGKGGRGKCGGEQGMG